MNICPIEDMMNIQLGHLIGALMAKGASVPISALYELANRGPSLTAILGAPALPNWALVASAPIHRVLFTAPIFQAGKAIWGKLDRGINLWMRRAICTITRDITEYPLGMRLLSGVLFSTIRACYCNLVFPKLGGYLRGMGDSTSRRAKVQGFLRSVGEWGFVCAARGGLFFAALGTMKSNAAAIITPPSLF